VVVHCYTTPADIQDEHNLAKLGAFCRKMGREGRQEEIGVSLRADDSSIVFTSPDGPSARAP
jgi:hypothetical protein